MKGLRFQLINGKVFLCSDLFFFFFFPIRRYSTSDRRANGTPSDKFSHLDNKRTLIVQQRTRGVRAATPSPALRFSHNFEKEIFSEILTLSVAVYSSLAVSHVF